jgi:hypothetical protein
MSETDLHSVHLAQGLSIPPKTGLPRSDGPDRVRCGLLPECQKEGEIDFLPLATLEDRRHSTVQGNKKHLNPLGQVL